MKKLIFLLLLIPYLGVSQYGSQDSSRAFDIAYGPGSTATGGRGGVLAIVNTLDWDAPLTFHSASGGDDAYYEGGFLAALQQSDVGYITFEVSGYVHIGIGGWYEGFRDINNKTVFGQSAPRGGITITDRSFRISGRVGDAKNLIFRYIRSRPLYDRYGVVTLDDDAFTWGMLFYGGSDIMVDHCSFSFAQDKALGAYIDQYVAVNGHGLYNITFQYNLLGDSSTGAYVEINPNRPEDPENMVDNIGWYLNGIVGVNRTPNLAFKGKADKINNVIHGTPTKNTSVYFDLLLNSINNYYQRQGTSPDKVRVDVSDSNSSNDPRIYASGNVFSGTVAGQSVNLTGAPGEDNSLMWSTLDAGTAAPSQYFVGLKHNHNFPYPYTEITAQQAFIKLISNGDLGANKYIDDNGYVQEYRDSYDANLLSVVANNQYYIRDASHLILPSLPTNTRPSGFDTDRDGLPDAWEIREYGNLAQSYRDDYDGDGIPNIEEVYNVQVDGVESAASGYTVNPQSGLQTGEGGSTASFNVVLNNEPSSNVVFNLTSNDTSEGTISTSVLTFTPINWNNNQNIIITGVDDDIDDGNVAYTITVSVDSTLSDDSFDVLPNTEVIVTNIDNDLSSEPSQRGHRVIRSGFSTIHN